MKKITSLFLCLILVAALAVPVLAAGPKIVDRADLLTQDQKASLEAKAQAIADQYGMDVVIVTAYDTEGTDVTTYADDYYDENGYGIGPDYSGVLFLLSMEDRRWAISTCGDAIYALTDYGIEELFGYIRSDLGSNRFYEAFDTYLDRLPEFFQAYKDGSPIDGRPNQGGDGPGYIDPADRDNVVYYDPEPGAMDYIRIVAVALLIGAAVGGIAILIMRGQMNTARAQRTAGSYLVSGSYQLRRVQDIFLYSRVTKTPRPKSNSGGGGSSTHSSSMGRSHGGRSGGF
ncbi:MAG: TPM domain-containing protein [Oscillospiraceae bacterium]|nr:TPM domain-containing protein [Oscillospiraceae bacterium]